MHARPTLPKPRLSLALAALLAAAACGGGSKSTTPPPAATLSSIALTPSTMSLAVGATQQMVAVGSYSDGSSKDVTADATWSSNATAVATVSTGGLVTVAGGATAGQVASITASLSGKTQVAVLTVTGGGGVTLTSVTVAPAAPTVAPGGTQQLTATANYSNGSTTNVTGTATWTTSAAAVATVSTAGLVTAAGGATNGQTATITATFQGQAGTSTITIGSGGGGSGVTLTPAGGSVKLGRTLQLVATLTTGGTDVTRTATWSSSAAGVFTVSNAGLVTPAAGATAGQTATITATSGASSGQVTVTVAAAAAAIGPGQSNDPLIPQQWFLANTGQNAYSDHNGVAGFDIHPATAYAAGIQGAGVKVAVIDSGLEIAHEDLSANVVTGSYNFGNGTADPTSTATDEDHGTMVTGLIGAVQGNAKGGMGVAPGVGLNGYNFLGPGVSATSAMLVAALGQSSASPQSNDVWVFNQSFGLSNTTPAPQDDPVAAAYADGTTSLRGGRGAVYVKSAGNGFSSFGQAGCTNGQGACCAANTNGLSCQNASLDPANTLPFNIVVGALNASGVKSSYSTAGSAVWVSAPGGEYGLNVSYFTGANPAASAFSPAMVTTDQSGCDKGFAKNTGTATLTPSDFNLNVGNVNPGCNYTNSMNGTSSAAPVTSGVVALMLEANPTLTWRDVKHILATTAVKVDASNAGVSLGGGAYVAEQPWFQNAAGRWFHNWYGFGLVDAGAAVAAARTYAYGSLGTFTSTPWVTSAAALNKAIPDNSAAGVSDVLAVNVTGNLTVEAVQVNVQLTHSFWGDLGIEITSPSGTRSVMLTVYSGLAGYGQPSGVQDVISLSSNAFYGENANGNWTIKLVDAGQADTGTLDRWQIKVSGH